MKLSTSLLAAAALFFGIVTGASAQATRTWVSGVGDDANPCSRTAPCKTFAGAISKTAAKGEINVLDPGGFGTVTITKSITIRGYPFEAGVLAAGVTQGILVANTLSTDEVILEGLDIDGVGTGTDGIRITGGGSVIVRNCVIRHFTQLGINMQSATANTRLLVEDSVINTNNAGILVKGVGGVANNAIVHRTTIDTHPIYGISIEAPGQVYVSASHLIGGAGNKLQTANGGQIISYGNNVIRDPTQLPTSTLPLR